jgi:hypothetical protein
MEQQLRRRRRASPVWPIPLGLATLLLAVATGAAFGQVSGKVIGNVTDRDTRQPLVGAQIVVEGTNLGNVTNEDGYYFINNVPVGLQRVTTRYLGYQARTQEERILAGHTSTMDFALESEVVQAEAIKARIVIEREPLVIRDNMVSKTRFTATENRPIGTVQGVITLAAGVYRDQVQDGFIVRGGRGSETATYIDGALVTDFLVQRDVTQVSGFAVEEVSVTTGGFNAEFGNAQSGIVNIVTREGGQEYHGSLRFTTDEFSDVFENSYGFNQLQASIGGPVFGGKLMIYGSLEATGLEDATPSAAGFNPAVGDPNDNSGSTRKLLPDNRADRLRAQGKLTSYLTGRSKLTGTYLLSRDQIEDYNTEFPAYAQGLSDAERTKTQDVIVGYDQEIFKTPERSLNLQVRGNWHQSRFFNGVPKSEFQSVILLEQMGQSAVCQQGLCDASGDTFDDDFLGFRFRDVEFFFEDFETNSLHDLGNLSLRSNVPDPIFGVPDELLASGHLNFFFRRDEDRAGIRIDLDSQLNRVHRAKVGVEWHFLDLSVRGQRFTDNIFAQVYDVSPRVGAAYVQDRLDYGDLVIDLGLRWDYWDPNARFPLFAGIVSCEISPFLDDAGNIDTTQCRDPVTDTAAEIVKIVQAPTRNEFAPRIGVAHPITDATQVRLSYGKFFQLPELRHYFSSFLTDIEAAGGNENTTYGNPNLDYIETTAFEAGITHLISPNLVLDVVGYNKDRRGAIRLDVFQSQSIHELVGERRIYVNGDNGNVKGFDVTLSRRLSNYWASELAWSLQWARGTTSSPIEWASGAGFGRNFDPLFPGRLLTPPSELQPESFDRLHNINWQFQLSFPDDFHRGTLVGTILQNLGVYLIYNLQSGLPYTRRSTTGQFEALEDLNRSRMPWIHDGNLGVTKAFGALGAVDFDVFIRVINFLGVKNVVNVNPTSGRPDVTGLEEQLSASPRIPLQMLLPGGRDLLPVFVDGASTQFPVSLSDIRPEFRDLLARQDIDGDGIITREESATRLAQMIRAFGPGGTNPFAAGGNSPYHYGEPRQIRFGAELRF